MIRNEEKIMENNIITSETTILDVRKNILYESQEILSILRLSGIKSIIDKNCSNLYDKLVAKYNKLNNMEYSVGVAAGQSAGKSTVLNTTVLEYPVLPFCTGSTTCVPTIIKYGKEIGIEISVKNVEKTGTEENEKIMVTEARNIKLSCSSISKTLYEKLLKYLAECHKVLALENAWCFTKQPITYYNGKTTPQDFNISYDNPKQIAMMMAAVLCAYVNQNADKSELDGEQIEALKMQQELLRDLGLKDNEKYYTVTLYWDTPLLEKGLVFYDLPGLDSNNTNNNGYLSHEEITKMTINEVQTTIYLFKPEVTNEGKDIVAHFLNTESIRELKSKNERVIIAVNKIDLPGDVSAVERALKDAEKSISDYSLKAKVYGISSQVYGDYIYHKNGAIKLHNTYCCFSKFGITDTDEAEEMAPVIIKRINSLNEKYPMTKFSAALDNLVEKAILTNIVEYVHALYELLLNLVRYVKHRVTTIEILKETIDDATKKVVKNLQELADKSSGEVQLSVSNFIDDSLSDIEKQIDFSTKFDEFITSMKNDMSSLKSKCSSLKDKLKENWCGDIVITRNNGSVKEQPNYDNWISLKSAIRDERFDAAFKKFTLSLKSIIKKIQDVNSDINTGSKKQYENILNELISDIDKTIKEEHEKLDKYEQDSEKIKNIKEKINSVGTQLKDLVNECLLDISLKLEDTGSTETLNSSMTENALKQQDKVLTNIITLMKEKADKLSTTGIFATSVGLIYPYVITDFINTEFTITDSWVKKLEASLNPESLVATYVFDAKQEKKAALLEPAMNLNDKVEDLIKTLLTAKEEDIKGLIPEKENLTETINRIHSDFNRTIKIENIMNSLRTNEAFKAELKNADTVNFKELGKEIDKVLKQGGGRD